MSVLPSSSLKFECKHCDKIYLHHYANAQHRYPHCPDCKQAGLLLGRAEKKTCYVIRLNLHLPMLNRHCIC